MARKLLGHYLAGYRVKGTIGHGARSVIYKVEDPKTNEIFALKHVHRELAKDKRFMQQVKLEYDICNSLDHPSLRKSYRLIKERRILRVSDIFLLMEFVEGVTLEQMQIRNISKFCQICQDTAKGLHIMHEAGYVHADVKPNNIMQREDGLIKIIDFGQSCKINTVKERIQGTPDYIAPEQVKRRALTPRTDIFCLGATLYWLLTNKHLPTMIRKKQSGMMLDEDIIKLPHELNPAIPLALSSLTMKCVQKNPQDRLENMKQVIDRLELAIRQLEANKDPFALTDD
jgi:serine/threonine protein kinase